MRYRKSLYTNPDSRFLMDYHEIARLYQEALRLGKVTVPVENKKAYRLRKKLQK